MPNDQYHDRNDIGNFPVFNEFKVGMFENAAGEARKIIEVTILVGIEVSDQPGYQDTAEQGQQDTEDLCSGKT